MEIFVIIENSKATKTFFRISTLVKFEYSKATQSHAFMKLAEDDRNGHNPLNFRNSEVFKYLTSNYIF